MSENIIISFSGLNQGKHLFHFQIGNSFFNNRENSLINQGEAEIEIEITKHSVMLEADVQFKALVGLECDRCTATVKTPLSGADRVVIKLGGSNDEEDENDIIILGASETEVDLSHYVYESICLRIPHQVIPCRMIDDESVCNKEVLDKLNQLLVKDEPEATENPIWAKLKNLPENN
jgi:uncharacterized protein